MMRRPPKRSTFMGAPDERNYLSDLIQYRLATSQQETTPARGELERFHGLLAAAGHDDGSILLQEHWALYYRASGDIASAIPHLEQEIELIKSLIALGGPTESVGYDFLFPTLRLLIDCLTATGSTERARFYESQLSRFEQQRNS